MLTDPSRKYRAFAPVHLPDRQWPGRVLDAPPVWLSTDLRDGNQSLFEPMDGATKLRLFELLCATGFKEIEVGFPAASQTEYDFVRTLVSAGKIPADVTVGALTQAREPLIRRTVAALAGARRAIVHVYNATSPVFREQVFGMSQTQVLELAVAAVSLIRTLTAAHPETEWVLEYSPETFSATELPFALEVCDAVTAAWGATPERRVILNLPATVELSTPNVFADQVEWMHRHLARRDAVVLSVHPHNDRGTAVAAAELAVLAGAERVEGCLFGHGERTGNVDLVTLAMNLYSQGVHPGLDFSDIDRVARTVEACTRLPVSPRHPYAGDLVFTAFSGSHQDAIRKGFAAQRPDAPWRVPYLPVDPRDLGRTYDSVIRVNSQSGKGGVAWLLETAYGMVLPRRMQIEFSAVVKQHADRHGGELTAPQVWALFCATYLDPAASLRLISQHGYERAGLQGIRLELVRDGVVQQIAGEGNGPLDAAVKALAGAGLAPDVRAYEERALGKGGDARACAFVEVALGGESAYGVGLDENLVTASIRALLSAVSRARATAAEPLEAAA